MFGEVEYRDGRDRGIMFPINDDRVLMKDRINSIIPVMKDLVLVVVSETNPIAG